MCITWQEEVMHKYYYGRDGWIDGTSQFHNLIKQYAPLEAEILEYGAGPTNKTTCFLKSLGTVTGVDIDSTVRSNQYCDTTLVYDGVHIPCESDAFDLVVSNYVCEHIELPIQMCREIHRILRPSGYYIFRTPNLWHYVSLAAKLSPQWFHKLVSNRLRNLPKDSHVPYRTYHRMNTKKMCTKILMETNFRIELIKLLESEPSYGFSSRMMFYPMFVGERLLNRFVILENLRANILCVAAVNK